MNRSPLTYEEYRSSSYFPALDGLRAISCLLIISHHADFLGWQAINGHSGISVFFVLSGYLITMLAIREEARRGMLCLSAFYVRRTFRIFPAYYFTLLLYCLLIFGVDIQSSIERREVFGFALPYYLFYLNEYTPVPAMEQFGMMPPFFHSWSLGIEEKYYLIWPVLAFALIQRNTVVRATLAVSIIALQYIFLDSKLVMGLQLSKYAVILIGCLLAIVMEHPKGYAYLSKLAAPRVHLMFLGILLIVQLQLGRVDANIFDYIYPYIVAAFLIGLVAGRSLCKSLFEVRVLTFLGLRTYGMYLLHLLALNVVEMVLRPGPEVRLWQSPLYFAISVAVTVAAAEVLYRCVEKPGIELGRGISRRLTGKASSLSAA